MNPPYFEPDLDQRRAVSERHGLAGDWELLEPRGEIHAVYRVGDAVVRIPRNDPDCICDTLTEVVALRALARTPFPTPGLRAFDDRCDVVPVPYCVVEHFEGQPHVDQDASPETLAALGEALAWMHREVRVVPDPDGWLDSVEMEEPFVHLGRAYDAGAISPVEAEWTSTTLDMLGFYLSRDQSTVFVHNDVHELNVMTGSGGMRLIDWGDAGWGDPCFDFSVLPAHWIVPVMRAYGDAPTGVRARVIWNQLGKAMRRLGGPERRRTYGRRRLEAMRHVVGEILSG